MTFVLAIDQGTTSSRAIVFDKDMKIVNSAQQEFTQIFPQSGWVEHDPEEIWESVLATMKTALNNAKITAPDLAAIGITNQRETVVVWDRKTGKPIYNAIVWQDRRTAQMCEELALVGHLDTVRNTTGLLLDPYFSATKLRWILNNVEGAEDRAEKGELCFGTIDSFLIWRLTGGKRHVTDATNAARTMLYDIHKGEWSRKILHILDIEENILPEVLDCAADFGVTSSDIFGAEVAILGVAGDQQAATIGQACFEAGMMKSTYGTGCFALLNTGDQAILSQNRLLTTIAYRLDGKVTYALEGSIFVAGAVVQWLRDGLKIIGDAKETQSLAEGADDTQDVIMVPAFTGLGAPYWNPHCRGAVYGLTRNSGPAEFARAALRSVGFQTRDLLDAMKADYGGETQTLRVDGGMSASDYTMQFLADITGANVDRPEVLETTAMGVAWLAGMRAGIYPDQEEFAKSWAKDAEFVSKMSEDERARLQCNWKSAVKATISVKL